MHRKNGFSLVELMIAVSLGLIIVGVAAVALRNVGIAVTKTTTLMSIQARGQNLVAIMRDDLDNSIMDSRFPMHMTGASPDGSFGTSFSLVTTLSSLDSNLDNLPDKDCDLIRVVYSYSNGKILKRSVALPGELAGDDITLDTGVTGLKIWADGAGLVGSTLPQPKKMDFKFVIEADDGTTGSFAGSVYLPGNK